MQVDSEKVCSCKEGYHEVNSDGQAVAKDGLDNFSCVADSTPTPTPTSIPTQTTTNSGGPGDGKSDNLGCGSRDCSGNPQPSSQGQVLGASTGPQVLGLSTTSGEENSLLQIVQALGALTSAGLGFAFFKK